MLIKSLFFLFSITIFAIASTVLAVFNYNPFKSGLDVFAYFYIALYFALGGTFGLTVFFLKNYFLNTQTPFSLFWPSVRQGFLISLALTCLLFFKGLGILDWWVGIPVVVVVLLLELFFKTKKAVK